MIHRGELVTVKVYDFFAGCGGASSGFQAAGMEISFALDHEADAKATFEANFPNAHFEFSDIRDVSVDAVRLRVEAERPTPGAIQRVCAMSAFHQAKYEATELRSR